MKSVARYVALAMAVLSGITFLSGSLRYSLTYYTYHRVAPSAVDPFVTLFTGVGCLGFGRLYQLLGRSKSDTISKAQTEIELAHIGFLIAWFCFLFMVHTMNPPHRSVSSLIPVAFTLAAVYAVVVGFVMRKKFLRQSTEALPDSPRKALALWRAAHFISFSCAMSIAIFGVALKFLGSSWLVPGIFFGLSLCVLLLWRPSQLAVSTARPA